MTTTVTVTDMVATATRLRPKKPFQSLTQTAMATFLGMSSGLHGIRMMTIMMTMVTMMTTGMMVMEITERKNMTSTLLLTKLLKSI